MTRTLVILVNWRGASDTIECLESLLRLDREDFDVLVCDNASSDGSIESIQAWADGRTHAATAGPPWGRLAKPRTQNLSPYARMTREELQAGVPLARLTLIDAGDNLGFAGGNNVGIQAVLTRPVYSHAWLLNNDTVVESDCLSALIARCEQDPVIGMCGATLLEYFAPDTVQARGGSAFRNATARGRHIAFHGARSTAPAAEDIEGVMDYVAGASLFVTRAFLETVGPMNEDYFLYFEEIDWARRSKTFRLGYAPDAVVYHKEGGAIGSRSTGRPSDLSLYYLTRNALLFTAKRQIQFLPLVAARVVLDLVRYGLNRDTKAIAVTIAAASDALLGRKGIRA